MNPIVLAPTSLSSAPPMEYIDAAVEAGYDGIGIRLFRSPGINYAFHPVAGDDTLERQVKTKLFGANMPVYDILSYYLQPEMDIESMKPSLEYGAEIGARYALVIGDDPDWDRQVQNFGRFCEVTKGFGLTSSIEAPVTQRQVNTLDKALNLIKESGADNACVCLDPFHYFRTGHSPDQLKGQDPKLFPYTQIDDGLDNVPAPGGRCAPGEGLVPLDAILDALPANLPLSLEYAAGRDSGHTAESWAKTAIAATKKYLDGYYARKAKA